MSKKILFIDRDGTIIVEPPVTFQVDTLEQLGFLPGVIRNLYKIATELNYELVMVTNQDGLGTPGYPEEHFNVVQNKMLTILENEGIKFSAIHIDRSFEKENKPTRKPNTGMLTQYINADYDLKNSYVIGDRMTDVKLAQNLGCKSIFVKNFETPSEIVSKIDLIANTWDEIYNFLKVPTRKYSNTRKTKETDITVILDLDGSGKSNISTEVPFLDHMLEQIPRHSGIDLTVWATGDLHIDEHHITEDVAIALGETFLIALGDKRGIERYGFCLPMDDCLAQVALDFGGRSWVEWQAEFKREKIGEMPTELFFHFFKSFSDNAKCNLNIKAEGDNEHHKIEAIFKAFAKAIKMAVKRDLTNMQLPSTKGML